VGLINPSDYAYSAGGSNEHRQKCLLTRLDQWDECSMISWLNFYQWTMNARASIISNCDIFRVSNDLSNIRAGKSAYIYPVIYLKSSVNITEGEGTRENAFKLEMVDEQAMK